MIKTNVGWDVTRLDDVCEKITVGHVGPMSREYVDNGIPFLRSQNIQPFRLDLSSVKYISEEFHAKLKKSELRPGDVAIVRTGYPGTASVIPESLPRSNCADLVIIRPSSSLDPYYLTAYFNSPAGKGQVAGSLVGVAQQHFNVTVARQMAIPLPPIKTQRQIAGILSAYDNLIENNTRRIKILEEMAQALYREWFVHFRYPGHEHVPLVDSPMGPIPEGWEVHPVSDCFEILGGGTPSTKEPEYWDGGDITWYSPSDLTSAGSMFMLDSSKKITQLGLQKSSAKMFPPYSVMMTSRATIGVVALNTQPACTNQGFITCLPNERVPATLIYHWLVENREVISSLASGATFKEISRSTFRQLQFVLPDCRVVEEYRALAEPVFQHIEVLQRSNVKLQESRDFLLPRIVGGDVRLINVRT